MTKNILLFCALSATAHSATILYNSDTDFDKVHPLTNNEGYSPSVAGWVGYHGKIEATSVNTTLSPFASGNTYKIGIYNNDVVSGVEDYLYLQKEGGDTEMDMFAHTSTGSSFTAFSPAAYSSGLTAVWDQRGDNSGSYFVTVLVGGTWYASTTSISTSGTTSRSFDFLAGSWVEVFDDLASPLALGTTPTTSADLFDGETIDGLGYFVQNMTAASGTTNRTIRIDNIRIQGVPEPTATLLAFSGLGTLLLRRRR